MRFSFSKIGVLGFLGGLVVLLVTASFVFWLGVRAFFQGPPCISDPGVLSVGEVVHLKVSDPIWLDCRPDQDELPGFTWRSEEPDSQVPSQSQSASSPVEVRENGDVRGVAPGPFTAVARRGDTVVKASGVVLPAGWTMKVEPESSTMRVGQAQAVGVRIFDANGIPLPGVKFSISPGVDPLILRGPGLVSSTEPITFSAIAPGQTSLTGFVGKHSAQTMLTIVE